MLASGRGQDAPLLGMPFLVKGNTAVRGLASPGLGALYGAWIPAADAAVVALLERSGAVLVGTTRFTELALASSEAEIDGPAVSNPHDVERTVGGSSSGSAVAVADGRVPFAVGTDTGGSVRIPAAFAGVAGLKPTDDLLPRGGVLPVSWSLDQVGLLARDARVISKVLAASAPLPAPATAALDGLRIGIVEDAWIDHPRTDAVALRSFEACRVRLVDLGAATSRVAVPELPDCQPTLSAIVSYEAARSHGPAFSLEPGRFGSFVHARLARGAALSGDRYVAELAERDRYRARVSELWAGLDLLVLPTIPFVPPTVDEVRELGSTDHARLTRLGNIAGVPALSVPCGWTDEGLPLGLQIMARPGADALVLAVGAVLEVARGAPPNPQKATIHA